MTLCTDMSLEVGRDQTMEDSDRGLDGWFTNIDYDGTRRDPETLHAC